MRLALRTYFGAAKRLANRRVAELAWGMWRYLHLPVLLIMVAATALHVRAVWGLDPPMTAAAPAPTAVLTPVPAPSPPRAAVRPTPSAMPDAPAAPQPAPRTADPKSLEPADPARRDMDAVYAALREREAKLARERASAPPPPQQLPVVQAPTAAKRPVPTTTPAREPPTLAANEPWPKTLAEQFALMKARRAAGSFAHAVTETGFALTGRHTRLDCASCHTVPLKGERSASPRVCLDCHKKDDVHRGRRPDCAQCHTTNNWDERARP